MVGGFELVKKQCVLGGGDFLSGTAKEGAGGAGPPRRLAWLECG